MKLTTGGHLTFYMPKRQHTLEISLGEPTPLHMILAQAGIPLAEVAFAAVNGELVDVATATVQNEDNVRVFSAVDGG